MSSVTITTNGSGVSTSPADVIATQEYNQQPFAGSFPEAANSFPGETDRATHTMQITANENITAMIRAMTAADLDIPTNPLEGFNDFLETTITVGEGIDRLKELYNRVNLTAEERQELQAARILRSKAIFTFYIPTPMIWTNTNDYVDTSLTNMIQGATVAIAQGLSPTKGYLLGEALDVGTGLAALSGHPINPKIEVLFSNIAQRRFQFDFLFAPTSAAEATTLGEIIKRLRSEAAPTRQIQTAGFIWKAPSTFDITFLHNGRENTQIPKIQECVLEQIDVDHAPAGHWATFRTGFPVSTRLRLQFREREPNDRDMINIGY